MATDYLTLSGTQVTLKKDEYLYGLRFHPSENDIIVTYGKRHFILWQLQEDLTGVLQQSSLKVC